MSINIGKEWRWMDSLKKEKKWKKLKLVQESTLH